MEGYVENERKRTNDARTSYSSTHVTLYDHASQHHPNIFRCIVDATQSQFMHVSAPENIVASLDRLSLFVTKAYELQGFNHQLSMRRVI